MTGSLSRYIKQGFTLPETMAALAILGVIAGGAVVVTIRCSDTVMDATCQLQAVEVASEQMEKVLSMTSIKEGVEYGKSDRYPHIEWQTRIEVFDEPITGGLWVRAVCTSTYRDAGDQLQSLELTRWITRLTDQQAALLAQGADQSLVDDINAAAEYAGVTVEEIQQWVERGLVIADDGRFIKANLDLFKQAGGNPDQSQLQQQVRLPLPADQDQSVQRGD